MGRFLRAFLALESAGGLVLVAMMAVAMVLANSPLEPFYGYVVHGPRLLGLSPLHWINDGLMAVFFLLVALEIKREALEGELSRPSQIALPAVAAVGGMAAPALVYLAFAGGDAETARGWAIPSATDIAFSLGVLALLGSRVPGSLKVFLTALAIIDDLGAILIIALFYSGDLAWPWLGGAAGLVAALAVLNRLGVRFLAPYGILGVALWVCMLKSGVHATLAGVVLGLSIPLAPLKVLEQRLHPWVAFGILPIFALFNSGIRLDGLDPAILADPVFLGVALGLFLGKQVGVLGFTWGVIRLKLAGLPEGSGWGGFYGVALLTGIGFTMSLFIGGLAFPEEDAVAVRLGILAGSLASAVAGWAVLALVLPRRSS